MTRSLLPAMVGVCALGLLAGPAAAQPAAAPADPPRTAPPLETPSPSGAAAPGPAGAAAELRAGAPPASAAERTEAWDPRRRFHLGAEALTDLPLQIGARLWGELPLRLRLSVTLGAMPGAYLDAINGALVAGRVYERSTADVIRGSLSSSFVFRLHGGWRPLPRRGLYLELGYGLLALSGSVPTDALAAGGVPVPEEAAGRAYQVRSVLHMFDAEVGWQWIVGRGLSIRAAAGVAATRSAHTQVSPLTTDPVEAQVVTAAAAYLDQVYTTYVITPTATLAAGWRFL